MTRRLAIGMAVAAVVLGLPGAAATTVLAWTGVGDLPFGLAFAVLGAASGVTGAVVAVRAPGNVVGWVILGLGLGVGALLAASAYAEVGLETTHGPLPAQDWMAWFGDVAGVPIFFGCTGYLLLLFPTGRVPSPRWRAVPWAFGAVLAAASLADALAPGQVGQGVPNPVGLPGAAGEAARWVADVTDLLALPAMGLCAAALVVRLRGSRGVERQQLTTFTYVAVVAGVGLGLTPFADGAASDVAFLVGLCGVTALPMVAGLAILRYGLFGIDLVVKRTLVYGPLVALLVLTYLGLVLALQSLLRPVSGDSELAVAASTLAVAALFRPLRSRIGDVVDRRFYRQRYDAEQTMAEFGRHLRDQLDVDALCADLRRVVADTMQPAHVSLWLREGSR